MRIFAAVVHGKSEPFNVQPIDLAEPRDDEVLVKIVASGICHTDIAMQHQLYSVPCPIVLGHEGAGIVLKVGDAVSGLVEGDHVVLSYNYCDGCCACAAKQPAYCEHAYPLNFAGQRPDGSSALSARGSKIHGHFFGQSSFANYAVVNQKSVTRVSAEVPLDVVAPMGCGFQTGAGAVINALDVQVNSTIAVYGVGAVGLAAVMAARVRGCKSIIAIDRHESRLELAKELGATHSISTRDGNVTESILKLFNQGLDYCLDTTGRPELFKSAIDVLSCQGTAGLIGAPASGTHVAIDMQHLLIGRKIRGIIQGDSVPQNTIPMLIDWYLKGQFPIDRLIQYYSLDQINQAVRDMESGRVIKPVLKMC